ncbi:peroxidase [Mycolicibacterium smegmatis]|uniref:Peroxidase n=2 Tax=Mycolicibacterium smegmatis (strain ATCC 700084 / mc(2)155) TaxID=246196 RepID=A0R5V4_MYCS2|nr:peroxidase [Mycolicibacterium smegmatis]ABK73346.1 peroxidase [Mycolicibacterium smegmatis MC2 155]AFP42588.1 Animal heme peroxidase [Mycolicibacterium smegmatis MC2 155]AIU11312.1 peroxidase [Mycolicibacterium smegmatis MC2 155]AIU17936.1 peroxidase [Mycolicibacterium smegmatis]AIU24560.1 peroxidase [Mycolicibacterium smegmatis]
MRALLMRSFIKLSETVDRRIGWDKLPAWLGISVLVGIRDALREHNLFDSYEGDPPRPQTQYSPAEYLTNRTPDGSYNDLSDPSMGMANTRFGRNVAPSKGRPEQMPHLMDPNPRLISTELLLRDEFRPATTLNVLAAAWLQFETHDWFSHGTDANRIHKIPVPEGDHEWNGATIDVPATPADPDSAPGHTTFINRETHWWDASQIYGNSPQAQKLIRTDSDDGKVLIDGDGFIGVAPEVIKASGAADGWWVGSELMGTIFMREHNAICDRLRAAYPEWTGEQIFNKARLINAALIAKIHTVEWTPAILAHPTLHIGMRANWFGLAGEAVGKLVGRIGTSDLISGIPGSDTEHHSAAYSITEDFVTVYRMHPLIPDDYTFLSLAGDTAPQELSFTDLHGVANARGVLKRLGIVDCLYSLGVAHPGAVTLHNSPKFMRQFQSETHLIDLIAVDILRSRERGVPRYNEFRRQLRLKPATSFEEISGGDQATADRMREIYGGDIEKVDTMVGMFGEKLPAGFGFSDTAFRIFVLMATRRLKSDRFYTVDFTPQVYTPEGMAWIADNTMTSVLLRHYPTLEPVLRNVKNPFAPWPRMSHG